MATKKKDDELSTLVVVNGVFSLGVLILDLTYKHIGDMFTGGDAWTGVVAVILHAAAAILWVLVIKYWQDPNKDVLRGALLAALILCILVVGGHRAGYLEQSHIQDYKVYQIDGGIKGAQIDTVIEIYVDTNNISYRTGPIETQ